MDNLSTASNDISSQIGALELGDNLEIHGDCALEAAGEFGPGPARTTPQGGCTIYRCIGNAALEAAGAIGPSPTITSGCPTLICR